MEKKDAHSNIGTACTDFEEGRNAASIRVEVVIELNGSLQQWSSGQPNYENE